MASEVRPVTFALEYPDGTLAELVQQYKRAYIAAGFVLASEVDLRGAAKRLVLFKYKVAEYPHKSQGAVILLIGVQYRTPKKDCVPCEVQYDGYGVFGDDYSPEQRAVAEASLRSANAKAGALIRDVLKVSMPELYDATDPRFKHTLP